MVYFKYILITFLGSLAFWAPAQNANFKIAADSMSSWMKQAEKEVELSKKKVLVDRFTQLLERTLKQAYSFDYSFDSIPHVRKLTSPNNQLHIFSWAIPSTQQGGYIYGCVLQHKRLIKDNPLTDVFVLEDVRSNLILPEEEELTYPNWFGGIYYQLIEQVDQGKTYYTLLGFDFNNNITRKKIIEILHFNAQGFPQFGAPLFVEEKRGLKSRIIFEYTSQSVMYLKYHPELKKIVFNYLYPIVSEKKGDKRYYVPDVTYDSFEFKFGKWMKESNIHFRNPSM